MARKFSELRAKMSPEARARVDARIKAAPAMADDTRTAIDDAITNYSRDSTPLARERIWSAIDAHVAAVRAENAAEIAELTEVMQQRLAVLRAGKDAEIAILRKRIAFQVKR